MLLGVGASKKVYADDLFNTRLWIGNGSNSATQTMTTGIDLVNNDGMVWVSNRTTANNEPKIIDTVRGQVGSAPNAPYYLRPSVDNPQGDRNWQWTFLNNGFSFNQDYGDINGNGEDMCAWSFRRQAGFFDIITYSGDDTSNRAISHNLKSAPGIILIKALNATKEWHVWHRDQHGKVGVLNTTASFFSNSSRFPTIPTSTNFYVGNDSALNDGSTNYIAYLFAGGESTASEAVSVDFNGTSQYLSIPDSTDYEFGSGDFTVEAYINHSTDDFHTEEGIVCKHFGGYSSWRLVTSGSGQSSTLKFIWMDSNGNENTVTGGTVYKGQWTHVAVSRSGNTIRMFVNGLSNGDVSFNNTIRDGDVAVEIGTSGGRYSTTDEWFSGKISNVRIVKGTGVYTSAFKPSTTALTSITNTKLLCCQSSAVTTATTSTGSITNNSATASTDSPFDDPAAYVFGENKDQNVVKCGTYRGSGVAGMEVNIGFEPTWIMMKAATRTGDWYIMDSMRGVTTGGNDALLKANTADADGLADVIEFTSTGFRVIATGTHWNNSGHTYSYLAIRRPDGYVGKPAEAGTDVFAIDTGGSSSTIPDFDSGFPVDMALLTNVGTTDNNFVWSRLTGKDELRANSTNTASTANCAEWDSNEGFGTCNFSDNSVAWMWKRHAGFDVLTFEGLGFTGQKVPHGLNAVPEMMWVKRRNGAPRDWQVYHKDLNGGTNPEQYKILLNDSAGEASTTTAWSSTAPTSSHITLGHNSDVNLANTDYLGILFASVAGISKVGSYTGNGSTTGPVITTGFAPKLIMIKRSSGDGDWYILDTLRGLSSSSNKLLKLNDNDAQSTPSEVYVEPSSTGFQLKVGYLHYNYNNDKYIYYAHA